MSIEEFEFDDLPENEIPDIEKKISVTIKLPQSLKNMLSKIAHRERRNIGELGTIIIEDWVTEYIEKYKSNKK